MPATITPHDTVVKAAEVLGVSMPEVDAMIQDGTLDAFEENGTLRVSRLSIHKLWFEQGLTELRAMGVR